MRRLVAPFALPRARLYTTQCSRGERGIGGRERGRARERGRQGCSWKSEKENLILDCWRVRPISGRGCW
eukprot:218027-Pleurochrysis_carterae.AAC.2